MLLTIPLTNPKGNLQRPVLKTLKSVKRCTYALRSVLLLLFYWTREEIEHPIRNYDFIEQISCLLQLILKLKIYIFRIDSELLLNSMVRPQFPGAKLITV